MPLPCAKYSLASCKLWNEISKLLKLLHPCSRSRNDLLEFSKFLLTLHDPAQTFTP